MSIKTIEILIEDRGEEQHKAPKVIKPNPNSPPFEVNAGDHIHWSITNRSSEAKFWVQLEGFHLYSDGPQDIPTLFGDFSEMGDHINYGAELSNKQEAFLSARPVSAKASPSSIWSYTILLIGKNGVIHQHDPFVVISGGGGGGGR